MYLVLLVLVLLITAGYSVAHIAVLPPNRNIIGKCLSTPIIEPLAQKLINKLCIVIILSRDG